MMLKARPHNPRSKEVEAKITKEQRQEFNAWCRKNGVRLYNRLKRSQAKTHKLNTQLQKLKKALRRLGKL